MKEFLLKNVIAFVLSLFVAHISWAENVPSSDDMNHLRPQAGKRLQIYDRFFPAAAKSALEIHTKYSDPQTLADIEVRLQRVRDSGDPQDVFSPEERAQLKVNLAELRSLESKFFDRWYLKKPMDTAIRFQKWLTSKNSPAPHGAELEKLMKHWKQMASENLLYKSWNEGITSNHASDPKTWGELLLRFNQDTVFRAQWVSQYPETLPMLNKLSEIWAWEDSSVRSVTVKNSNTPAEHWVLERQERANVPNRFTVILNKDFYSLLKIEYSSSLNFNRLSKISTQNGDIIYHLESVEKGRTMEPALKANQNGTDKQTFKGAEFLRKSKSDEFLQREYIKRGSLNLFLGMRTMQLNQIQALMKISPELMLSVGQLGFSVTGGMAQTVSNRTDSPREQYIKAIATLIDYVEFAQTKDVKVWFQKNTQHVLRTILGGVGSGGAQALAEPTSQNKKLIEIKKDQVIRTCQSVFI